MQESAWAGNRNVGSISVYLPKFSAEAVPNQAEYFKWLAMESPYSDLFYEQRTWGNFLICDNEFPSYQKAAACAMGRLFSETGTHYPKYERVKLVQEEIGLSMMEALMYSQMINGYDGYCEKEALGFTSVDGHTMFSSGYFSFGNVARLLLGKYNNTSTKNVGYIPLCAMWNSEGFSRQSIIFFRALKGTLHNWTGQTDTKATPDPFGLLKDVGQGGLKYPVEAKRKAFLFTMLTVFKENV
jgi:hypothetical protein